MKTKLISLVAVLATLTSVIIAQQYERVLKIYKGGDVITYKVAEVDSIKFDKNFICEVSAEVLPEQGGSVAINGDSESEKVDAGSSVTLTATPNSNYSFVGWKIEDRIVSTENPYVTTVNESTDFVAVFEEKLTYCTPTGNISYSKSRKLSSFILTNGVNSLTVSNIQTSYSDAVYKDKTSSVLEVASGSTLSFSDLEWEGIWMHGYVYIDYNKDGIFNQETNANGSTSGELVSFNYFDEVNSEGNIEDIACGVSEENMPSWTLPSDLAPGNYCLRFKIDWESLDPCGSTESGNSIQENSGCVCDITLRVLAVEPLATVVVSPEVAGTAQITDENPNDQHLVLTATNNRGYVFENWSVDGVVVSTENPYSATVTQETEFTANFRVAQSCAVSVVTSEGGEATTSADNVYEGETVVLEATADAGYIFTHWSVNGVEVSDRNPYTATITESTEFTANFKIPEACTILVQAGEGGVVNTDSVEMQEGDSLTLEATPNEGYLFVSWTIDGNVISTDNPCDIKVTTSATIVANFERREVSLPKVYINTPGGVAITSKEIWTEGSFMRILDKYGDEIYNDTTSIRGRGNSTWNYPKKPYALKLDSKASILGMPKHKRWVLLANWMDRTLMRNAVSFEMARQCMDWAPRGEFVELYLNDVHQGNYYLCEQIKIDKNRVDIAEFEDGEGNGEDGGFLLEFDTNYQAEINYFFTANKNFPVTIKDPDEEFITSWTHPYYTYINNYVDSVETFLKNGDFASAFDRMDTVTYIDYWFIHELTTNIEPQHPKSCYMYKDAGGKIKAGPVWDFDWGTFLPDNSGFLISNYLWYGYLLNSPDFVATVKARWATLKPKFLEIPTFIDETAEKIRESSEVNIAMWPISGVKPNGDEEMTFDEAVARMKQALLIRINSIDAAVNNL